MGFKRRPPAGNVRRVKASGQNIRGVMTNKAGRLVQFESWAERALTLRLDRDRDVLDYSSQPEAFTFSDEQGKRHTYTPDFVVWRRTGPVEIHEVTLAQRRTRPDMRRREEAARQICRARGWRYVVHTEHSIPQGCELANLLALAGYRPTIYANQDVTRVVLERLGVGQAVALGTLVEQIGHDLNLPQGQVTAALCHLLWHGELMTDLEQLLFDRGAIVPGVRVWIDRRRTDNGSPAA
jgi:hypothetical protein